MALKGKTHIWVESRHCVACGRCVTACRQRHGAARLRRPGHSLSVAFPEVCQHCERPLCVESCIGGGMARDAASGLVRHDPARCVGCWSCIMACPYAAVHRDLRRGAPVSTKCDRCSGFRAPACASACTTGALKHGDTARLSRRLTQLGGLAAPLLVAGLYAVLPLAGLAAGLLLGTWARQHNHAVGIAAGTLAGAAFAAPLLGRLLWVLLRQSAWTRAHMALGALAAGLAMAHSLGRFGANAQTFAALSMFGLVLTGVAYRHVQPLVHLLASVVARHGEATAHADGASPRSAAAAAAARQAASWARGIERTRAVLAACRAVHIAWAILTIGLIAAHVLIMTVVGAQRP